MRCDKCYECLSYFAYLYNTIYWHIDYLPCRNIICAVQFNYIYDIYECYISVKVFNVLAVYNLRESSL